MLSLYLFSILSLGVSNPAQGTMSVHPVSEVEFAQSLNLKQAFLAKAEGLEFWCEDAAQFKQVQGPLLQAWKHAQECLGGPYFPEGVTARIVILRQDQAIRDYPQLLAGEAKTLKLTLPTDPWVQGVFNAGSAWWGHPPLALIDGGQIKKNQLVTRAVHDAGLLYARFAMSPYGATPPEFFQEGVAGLLIRHAVKKPEALVSHKDAAATSSVHGYGVFAGIGAAMNDGSNHPRSWPNLLKRGVKAMRKEKELDPASRLDGLLKRDAKGFARSDYGYAWAAMEFLSSDRYPVGEEAVAIAKDRKWKPAKADQPGPAVHRRGVLLAALEELRHPEYATWTAPQLGEQLTELLLEGAGEEPEAFHEAFMVWVERFMPKK